MNVIPRGGEFAKRKSRVEMVNVNDLSLLPFPSLFLPFDACHPG